jgi:hypothetical protein
MKYFSFFIIICGLETGSFAQGLQFFPFGPCRLADTRGGTYFTGPAPFGGPSLTPQSTTTFTFLSAAQATTTAPSPCGQIPATAQAYVLNVTVVPQAFGAVDYVTIWPASAATPAPQRPVVATLDDPEGEIMSNAVVVGELGAGVNVYNSGAATTDIVIDMNGYYAPAPVIITTGNGAGNGTQLPSFPLTITPLLITMGTGAIQSAANGVSIVPGPFTLASSGIATDNGSVQIGANAANQVVCYLVNLGMTDATGAVHFTATGFSGATCLPGPDPSPGDWMTLIPVVAGAFQTPGPQYIPVTALQFVTPTTGPVTPQ